MGRCSPREHMVGHGQWPPNIKNVPSHTGVLVKLGRRLDRIFCVKLWKPANAPINLTGGNTAKGVPALTKFARHTLQTAHGRGLGVAGELGIAASGVVLLTNSPGLLAAASGTQAGIMATYRLRATPAVSDEELQQLQSGIDIRTALSTTAHNASMHGVGDDGADGADGTNAGDAIGVGSDTPAVTSGCSIERGEGEGELQVSLRERPGGSGGLIVKEVRNLDDNKKVTWCHRTVSAQTATHTPAALLPPPRRFDLISHLPRQASSAPPPLSQPYCARCGARPPPRPPSQSFAGISLDGLPTAGHAAELGYDDIGRLLGAYGGGDESLRAEKRPAKKHYTKWAMRKLKVRKMLAKLPKRSEDSRPQTVGSQQS